jgi:hypothetical protein
LGHDSGLHFALRIRSDCAVTPMKDEPAAMAAPLNCVLGN